MSACACALLLCALSSVASGVLRSPSNVSLNSTNLDLVLWWDPPEGAPPGLRYTAEYTSSVTRYRPGCVNTSSQHCDLSGRLFTAYGTYSGRVRAQLGGQSSDWAPSNPVTLDKDTFIGPPSVSLLPVGPALEVIIQDPVFSISTLRNVYSSAFYNLTYWKQEQPEQVMNLSGVQQNRLSLPDLDPLSTYCVQVQINTIRNLNPSRPSTITCESTSREKGAQWPAAVAVLVVMAATVALVVLAALKWRSISQLLCPKDALSEHYKQFLLAPPSSTMLLAMQKLTPPEEINHQVSVVSADRTAEGGPLLSQQGAPKGSDALREITERTETDPHPAAAQTSSPEQLGDWRGGTGGPRPGPGPV
ncbi:cytokine receptor family member b4 [Menidia menidia]